MVVKDGGTYKLVNAKSGTVFDEMADNRTIAGQYVL
jgi:hypothetical protein